MENKIGIRKKLRKSKKEKIKRQIYKRHNQEKECYFGKNFSNSVAVYSIKKLLIFELLYCISAVIGEAVIILLSMCIGFDVLKGDMPGQRTMFLMQYYGYSVFIIVTILFCKYIEHLQITNRLSDNSRKIILKEYILGGIAAVILVLTIIVLCVLSNDILYYGLNKEQSGDIIYLLLVFIGLIIQSAAEELMCRGFLLQSLMKRTSLVTAIFVSTVAFIVPHLPTLFEMEQKYIIVGSVNLILISVIFSLLVLERKNIWCACGLHGVWNFMLFGITGINLSGSEAVSDSIFVFKIPKANILNGGVYGIEAGVITSFCLGIMLLLQIRFGRRKWYVI